MVDFGIFGEFLIIVVLALVLIGPKELPTILRTVGRWIQKTRYWKLSFHEHFDRFLNEGALDEIQHHAHQKTLRKKGKKSINARPFVSSEGSNPSPSSFHRERSETPRRLKRDTPLQEGTGRLKKNKKKRASSPGSASNSRSRESLKKERPRNWKKSSTSHSSGPHRLSRRISRLLDPSAE